MANSILCVGLSALSGILTSTGYNIVAYEAFISNTTGRVFGRCFSTSLNVANIALSLMGIGVFVLASKYGPVSVGMPVQVGFSLLLNMLIQTASGMKRYTKSMCVGTVSLAAGAVCLVDVGPTDPTGAIDVLELVSGPGAITWLALMLVLLGLSVVVVCTAQADWPTVKILCYAALVADSTALGATVGKMLTVTDGALLALCLFCYALMGVGSLGGGLAAARACDMSVYLPTTQSIQLVINALTGLIIWGDGLRVQGPIAYPLLFVQILLSVYLCSEFDPVESTRSQQSASPNALSNPMSLTSQTSLARELIKDGQVARAP